MTFLVTDVMRQSPIAVAEANRKRHVVKTGFSKKLSSLRYPDNFFGTVGKHARELYAAILYEEYKISVVALCENQLVVFKVASGSTSADLYKQTVRIDLIGQKCRFHAVSPLSVVSRSMDDWHGYGCSSSLRATRLSTSLKSTPPLTTRLRRSMPAKEHFKSVISWQWFGLCWAGGPMPTSIAPDGNVSCN
jgi:hypothetical protein